MPLFRSRRRVAAAPAPAPTTRTRGGLFSSRRTRPVGPMATNTRTHRTTRRSRRHGTTTVARRPTMGDKIHGMAKSIMGSLTNNRYKKREGEAMKAGSRTAATTTTRRRRRW